MRTVYLVDETILGGENKEGLWGLRRFVMMLQDLLDEEGLPIDVRIGVTSHNVLTTSIKELRNHIPEWIITEARKLYYEELPG